MEFTDPQETLRELYFEVSFSIPQRQGHLEGDQKTNNKHGKFLAV